MGSLLGNCTFSQGVTQSMKQHLNNPIIKNTQPNDKTQKLSDGDMFLYVEPNGSKRWLYRYQFEGKEQLLSLGLYSDITLKQARLERDTLKIQINAGINPAACSDYAKVSC